MLHAYECCNSALATQAGCVRAEKGRSVHRRQTFLGVSSLTERKNARTLTRVTRAPAGSVHCTVLCAGCIGRSERTIAVQCTHPVSLSNVSLLGVMAAQGELGTHTLDEEVWLAHQIALIEKSSAREAAAEFDRIASVKNERAEQSLQWKGSASNEEHFAFGAESLEEEIANSDDPDYVDEAVASSEEEDFTTLDAKEVAALEVSTPRARSYVLYLRIHSSVRYFCAVPRFLTPFCHDRTSRYRVGASVRNRR